LERDPSSERPLYGVAALSAELGSNYIAGADVALLGTLRPGVAIGGSAFFSPLCSGPSVALLRALGELRLGTPYAEYKKSLAWFGVGVGLAYLSNIEAYPSPAASVAVGGDVRVTRPLWLELSARVNFAELIGPDSFYVRFQLTAAIEVGFRFDFAR
jgi:hypothetical protein